MNYPLVLAITGGRKEAREVRASLNIAVVLANTGKRVLLVDWDREDDGVIELPASFCSKYIEDLLGGKPSVEDHLSCDRSGVLAFPLLSRITSCASLSPEAKLSIISCIESTGEKVDIVIIDTGVAPPGDALFLNGAAHHIVVTVSPCRPCIESALRFMEAMFRGYRENSFKILVNGVVSEKEGSETFGDFSLRAERYLAVSVDYLGCILKDEYTVRAAEVKRPVAELFPESRAGRSFAGMAEKITGMSSERTFKGGMQLFWREMVEAGR